VERINQNPSVNIDARPMFLGRSYGTAVKYQDSSYAPASAKYASRRSTGLLPPRL
jgi:hypothetical protein